MKIRELSKKDISAILNLEKDSAPGKPYYSKYRVPALNFIFNNPQTCKAIGLFNDKQLIGWGAYRTNWYRNSKDNGAEISSIVVDKNYRRKGHGRKILNEILAMMKEKGIDKIFLTVYPLNLEALLLYLNSNFVIYNFKNDVYGKGSDRVYLRLNS